MTVFAIEVNDGEMESAIDMYTKSFSEEFPNNDETNEELARLYEVNASCTVDFLFRNEAIKRILEQRNKQSELLASEARLKEGLISH